MPHVDANQSFRRGMLRLCSRATGEDLPIQHGSNSLNREFSRHVQREEELRRGHDEPFRHPALVVGRGSRHRFLPRALPNDRPASGLDSTTGPSRKRVSPRCTTFSTPDERAVVPVGRSRDDDVQVAPQGRAQAQRAGRGAHARTMAGARSARERSSHAAGTRPAKRCRRGLSYRNPAPRCGRRPPWPAPGRSRSGCRGRRRQGPWRTC